MQFPVADPTMEAPFGNVQIYDDAPSTGVIQ